METIEQVAARDSLWRKYALKLCGNQTDADDLVQEMYLKIFDVNKKINRSYVYLTIKSIFLDEKRKSKQKVELQDIEAPISNGLDDYEQALINRAKKLKFYEVELLDMYGEHSLRQLEERYKIPHKVIHRIIIKAKKKIWQKEAEV